MPRAKSGTLFFLSAGLLLLGAMAIPNFYPAPIPVLGPDGSPLLKADGMPVVHRDMAQYYRYMMPTYILLGGSVCLFFWWVIRLFRFLSGRRAS